MVRGESSRLRSRPNQWKQACEITGVRRPTAGTCREITSGFMREESSSPAADPVLRSYLNLDRVGARAEFRDDADLDESWLADGWEPLLRKWIVYLLILSFAGGTQLFVEPQSSVAKYVMSQFVGRVERSPSDRPQGGDFDQRAVRPDVTAIHAVVGEPHPHFRR